MCCNCRKFFKCSSATVNTCTKNHPRADQPMPCTLVTLLSATILHCSSNAARNRYRSPDRRAVAARNRSRDSRSRSSRSRSKSASSTGSQQWSHDMFSRQPSGESPPRYTSDLPSSYFFQICYNHCSVVGCMYKGSKVVQSMFATWCINSNAVALVLAVYWQCTVQRMQAE
jgi:hypothetical protein